MPLGRVDMFAKSQKWSASSQTSSQVTNQSSILPMISNESIPNSESARIMSVRDIAKQYEELHCRNRRPDRQHVTSRTREPTGFPGRHSLHASYYADVGLKRKCPETAGNSTKERSFRDVSFLQTLHPLNGRESDATMSEPPLPKKAMVAPSQQDLTTEPQSLEVSIDDLAVCNAILQSPVMATETSEILSLVSAMETMEPRSPVSVMESSPEYEQTLEPQSLNNEMANVMESSPSECAESRSHLNEMKNSMETSPECAEPRPLRKETENAMESSPEFAEPLAPIIAMETADPIPLVGVMETLEPQTPVGEMETLEPQSPVSAMEESSECEQPLEQRALEKAMEESPEYKNTFKVIEAPFASEARLENRTSDNSSPVKAMETQSGLLPIMTSEARYLMALAERNSLPSTQLLTSLQPLCGVVPDATSRPEQLFLKRSVKQPKASKKRTNILGLTGRRFSKWRRELSMRRSDEITAESIKTGDAAACPLAGDEGQCTSETSACHFPTASSTKVENNITIAEEHEINVAIRHPVKKSLTKRFRHWLMDTFFVLAKKKSRRDQPKPCSVPRSETGFCDGALDDIAEGHSPSRESAVQQQPNCECRVKDSERDLSTSMAPACKNGELLACSATAASESGDPLAYSAATLGETGEQLARSSAASGESGEQLACSAVAPGESGEQLACSAAAPGESGEQLACSTAAPSGSGEQLPFSASQELSGSSGNDGTISVQGERDNHRNSVTTLLIEPFVRRNISVFIAERGAKLLLSGWKPF